MIGIYGDAHAKFGWWLDSVVVRVAGGRIANVSLALIAGIRERL